ncbi:hypothetical protein, conserved [Eimeria acervulina]|uniref:Tetratricopeptide repeat-containing protein n=1 Tax=Eimeria acervulina TaxID=5801 RepID=U6GJ39_EIMAC|nr:hypothetical protein, conserved [Eimeria acervulina]CDI79318.1 hypothetical protein, conserved [Eimeria acervulina]
MAKVYESNEEAAELLGLAYQRIGDRDTAKELQQQLLLVLSPKRFEFCASQIAAEICALEEGQAVERHWSAAAAADNLSLNQWLKTRDLCYSGEDVAAASFSERRLLLEELLTELLGARLEKGQVLSSSLSLAPSPLPRLQQHQQQQQQLLLLHEALRSLCLSLSVSPPSNLTPQQMKTAMHAAAAALASKIIQRRQQQKELPVSAVCVSP